jgi:hypothetical protein
MKIEELRDSKATYAFKVTQKRYDPFSEYDMYLKVTGQTRGPAHVPCSEMRVLDGCGNLVVLYKACKTPPKVPIGKHDEFCFGNCLYPMDVSLFNGEQWEIYLQKRLLVMKVVDFNTHPESKGAYIAEFPEIEKAADEMKKRREVRPITVF